MDVLTSPIVVQLMAVAGIASLAVGLIVPRLGVSLAIALFIAVLATFVIASRAGMPVPQLGWFAGIAVGFLGAAAGWFVRGRRRG